MQQESVDIYVDVIKTWHKNLVDTLLLKYCMQVTLNYRGTNLR